VQKWVNATSRLLPDTYCCCILLNALLLDDTQHRPASCRAHRVATKPANAHNPSTAEVSALQPSKQLCSMISTVTTAVVLHRKRARSQRLPLQDFMEVLCAPPYVNSRIEVNALR
jgi:hypothetical protein